MSMEFHCPSCNKKLFTYEMRERRFGNPIKTCKKCEAEYLDPRFYEPAISGVPEDEFSLKPAFLMLVIGAFILWRGIHLFSTKQLGTPDEIQWLMPSAVSILGAALLCGAVWEFISIKTGLKHKKMARHLEESGARVMSPTYVYKLQKMGYPVPEEFLKEHGF